MYLAQLIICISTVSALASSIVPLYRRDHASLRIRSPAHRPSSWNPGNPMPPGQRPTNPFFGRPRSPSPERGRVSLMTAGPVAITHEKQGQVTGPVLHNTPQNIAIPVTSNQSAKIKAQTFPGGRAAAIASGSRIVQVDVKGPGMITQNIPIPGYPPINFRPGPGQFNLVSAVNENPHFQTISGGATDGGTVTAEARASVAPPNYES